MTVGLKIKQLRKKHGMTQKQLAEKLGLAPTAVSAWERDANKPMMDSLAIMSKLFEVPITYFYGLEQGGNIAPIAGIVRETSYPYIAMPISAGIPETVDAVDRLDNISIPDSIMGRYAGQSGIHLMRVNGESMNRIIPNGSLIAVKKMSVGNIKNGDIVVYNDNFTYAVKRMYKVGDKVIFRPDSTDPSFTDYVTNADEQLDIIGKVVIYIVELD